MAAINLAPPIRAGLAAIVVVLLVCLLADTSEARPRCHGHKADIVGGHGANRLHGTPRPDVIVGGAGPDRIDGARGFDLICAGPGADTVLGENGGDTVFGGTGDDRLYGGLQDDTLSGEGGADLLIGGPAFNTLRGGPGDDYVRDGPTVNGGAGSDWISFADETRWLEYGLGSLYHRPDQRNLENVVGTRFRDVIYGLGSTGSVRGLGAFAFSVFPEYNHDDCHDFAHIDCGGQWPANKPIVLLDAAQPDPGVVVVGGPEDDELAISRSDVGVRVDSAGPIAASPECRGGGTQSVICRVPGQLGYVTTMTFEGNDKVTVEGNLGDTVTVSVDGGTGADVLRGGGGDETLYSGIDWPSTIPGPDGQSVRTDDVISGGGGDDSLMGGAIGPDRLFGGAGTDQLATESPCAGGVLDGGPGRADIANFVLAYKVRARLGGVAMPVHPRLLAFCTGPIRLDRSTEFLEGGGSKDILIGDGRSNFIAGHEGDDVIKGMGGNDNLAGEDGYDKLIGGGGSDHLDCGPGGGVARRDAKDPKPRGCH
jgi:Ca2+-binding RTX toxin-like protein